MKKTTFILFLLLSFFAGINVYAGGPVISAVQPDFQIKNIFEGKDLIHSFRLLNKGDELLKITRVKAKG